jgi:hypothetical protein
VLHTNGLSKWATTWDTVSRIWYSGEWIDIRGQNPGEQGATVRGCRESRASRPLTRQRVPDALGDHGEGGVAGWVAEIKPVLCGLGGPPLVCPGRVGGPEGVQDLARGLKAPGLTRA